MPLPPDTPTHARRLLDFIDASPTPWHAVASAEARLRERGFVRLEEGERWRLADGGRYYVVRGGASMAAFVLGREAPAETGFRIVGSHTDSPGLRVKPRPAQAGDGLMRLAVEVYGGPILATFTDRDLGLAGRLIVRTASGAKSVLVRFDQPLVRLPNLAIHMNTRGQRARPEAEQANRAAADSGHARRRTGGRRTAAQAPGRARPGGCGRCPGLGSCGL